MRKSSTDERLDDLNVRVSDGFNRVDAELRAVHGRIDALQRTMLQIGGGVIATLLAGFFGLIATQL